MSRDIFTDIYGQQDLTESTNDQIYRTNLEEFNRKYEHLEDVSNYDSHANYYNETIKFDPSAVIMMFVKQFYILPIRYFTLEEYCSMNALYTDFRHCINDGEIKLMENVLIAKLNEIQKRMGNGQRTSSTTS